MHYFGKMKIPKIAQTFRFTICELANHEVKMVCLEKDYNGKRPQWKKDTRKKFTVHRKTALKILVKSSQYI